MKLSQFIAALQDAAANSSINGDEPDIAFDCWSMQLYNRFYTGNCSLSYSGVNNTVTIEIEP